MEVGVGSGVAVGVGVATFVMLVVFTSMRPFTLLNLTINPVFLKSSSFKNRLPLILYASTLDNTSLM